jgi:exopolyphosphatase / guanosine-5'-triphosphate,3'-diphosphate pyrophosphatase
MRCACVDIGSNTTRLLVADCDGRVLHTVHEERVFTRIGAAVAGGDTIPVAKQAEVIEVVAAQLAIARAHGAERVRAVATAAIRRASDGIEFVRAIHGATGLKVEILSDREEARLAFVGAAGMLDGDRPRPLGVLDVGGGSSEVVVGEAPATISWWASVPIGSGTLAARYLESDPPAPAQLRAARREVRSAVDRLAAPRPAHTVAVGGSATSLCLLAGEQLDSAALEGALNVLSSEPSAAVAERFAIDPQRARLLPAGLLILEELSRALGSSLSVGRGGIREGVVLEAGAHEPRAAHPAP